MNLEKQRIAIAKVCFKDYYELACDLGNECYYDCVDAHNDMMARIPDYPRDLNACRDAWWTLNNQQQHDFWAELLEITTRDKSYNKVLYAWEAANATAAQRCEAFLRTIGKWEGS